MNRTRRDILKQGGGLGLLAVLAAAGLIRPQQALAVEWNEAAFATKTLDDAFKALGASDAAESGEVAIVAPEIAENGAVVPIGIVSKLPNTESIALLIEKNPNMLAAHYTLPPDTLAEVQSRVKMAQTSNVYALVKADGKFYLAKQEIKVTLGGCGG
jgi:sulfur-oxidizing protein SoxY